jgi:MFS family permease
LQTATRSDRWRWVAFAAALVAILMDLLDSTIANVAAPTIRADLGGSYSDLQWISASYTLAMAVMLLCGGRLSDIFGRKRMLLVGAAGFTAASAACALAPSAGLLIVFRALQGGLGAVMVPQVFGLIRDLFAPQEMGKAFGVLGPACGMAAILARSSRVCSSTSIPSAPTGARSSWSTSPPARSCSSPARACYPTSPRPCARGAWT